MKNFSLAFSLLCAMLFSVSVFAQSSQSQTYTIFLQNSSGLHAFWPTYTNSPLSATIDFHTPMDSVKCSPVACQKISDNIYNLATPIPYSQTETVLATPNSWFGPTPLTMVDVTFESNIQKTGPDPIHPWAVYGVSFMALSSTTIPNPITFDTGSQKYYYGQNIKECKTKDDCKMMIAK